MYEIGTTIHGLDRTDAAKKFEQMVIHEAKRVKPILKEQFLREYILGLGDADEIFTLYCRTFNVDSSAAARMVILKPCEEHTDLFFLKNIAEQIFGEESLFLCTALSGNVLIISDIVNGKRLTAILEKIRKCVSTCYNYEIMAVYSDIMSISEAPSGYEHLTDCLSYLFYANGSSILYEKEITVGSNSVNIDYSCVEAAVKNGDAEQMRLLINSFFDALEKSAPNPMVAKTYCLELYVCIIRGCEADQIDKYMKGIMTVQKAETLASIKKFVTEKAEEITAANEPRMKIYSALIKDTIRVIDENIENENLSLRWIAGNILYTNVDYLGKLFKKETSKNFSHYVMEKRMEMAKQLILEGKKDRIYEVAEKVGYGSNSQYFSQVFKKYTGVSPLEYKEFARLAQNRA